jgi:hypothetical protein
MEDDAAAALVPRWDAVAGRYDWTTPDPVVAAIEPAFVREAVVSEFDPGAKNVEVRAPRGVVTFADVYPRGTRDHAATDAPSPEPDFDPLEDWRVEGQTADDILISLPEGTPKMLRTLLTLLMGAMRRK